MTAWKLCHTQKRLRVLEPAPAIHQHEEGESAVPQRSSPEGEADESCNSNEPENRSDHQAMGPSNDEPQQGTKNLTAVERIDGKNIEDEKPDIDPERPLAVIHASSGQSLARGLNQLA